MFSAGVKYLVLLVTLVTLVFANSFHNTKNSVPISIDGPFERQCIMIGPKCLISNVQITRNNFSTLIPVLPSNFTKTVTDFEITLSILEILTGDICISLNMLAKFKASKVGINDVNNETFSACKNITFIDLSGNAISELPFELFENNKLLRTVKLSKNKIKEIDPKLFYPIWQLNRLEIQNNQIKELSPAVFKGSKSIEVLKINSNEITELDENGLIKGIPNLRFIFLADNDFKCDRVKQMLPTFELHNVTVSMLIDTPRKRTGPVDNVDGTPCIPNNATQPKEMKSIVAQPENPNEISPLMIKDLNSKLEKLLNDINHYAYEAPVFVPYNQTTNSENKD